MVRFKPLGFGNARNVGMGCLCAVAGLAKDLQVFGFVSAAECTGKNVINVSCFTRFDLIFSKWSSLFSDRERNEKKRV